MALIQGSSPWIGTDDADDIRTKGAGGKVDARGGDDVVIHRGPRDSFLQADLGEGNDLLLTTQGTGSWRSDASVSVNGGAGDDTIWGTQSSDILNGGDGNDFIGGTASNVLGGIIAQDTVHGGAGDDTIIASGHVYGDAGNDQLAINKFVILKGSGYFLDGGPGDDILDASGKSVRKFT